MKVRKPICLFVNHLRNRTKLFQTPYTIITCDELPDHIEDGLIYISENGKHEIYLGIQCPCKCGDIIDLNLVSDRRPCWIINWRLFGTISVQPSIWRKWKCKSHFYIVKNQIKWCK